MTADMSIDDVASQFGLSKSELIKNLRTDSMYQVACALDLPEQVSSIVRNPRQFNASVLERLVQSSDAMAFLGIEFGKAGDFVGKIDANEFRKAFGRMVSDIASGEVDTRTLNKAQDIEKYLKGFGGDAPNRKLKGSFSGESLLGRSAPPLVDAHRTGTQRGGSVRTQSLRRAFGRRTPKDVVSPRAADCADAFRADIRTETESYKIKWTFPAARFDIPAASKFLRESSHRSSASTNGKAEFMPSHTQGAAELG